MRDREQRGPIVAGDQGSLWGHQCSETTLTVEPGSITSEAVYWTEAAGSPHRLILLLMEVSVMLPFNKSSVPTTALLLPSTEMC